MVTEKLSWEELIKGGRTWGNRNKSMIKVRGHSHLGVKRRESSRKWETDRKSWKKTRQHYLLKVRGSFSRWSRWATELNSTAKLRRIRHAISSQRERAIKWLVIKEENVLKRGVGTEAIIRTYEWILQLGRQGAKMAH